MVAARTLRNSPKMRSKKPASESVFAAPRRQTASLPRTSRPPLPTKKNRSKPPNRRPGILPRHFPPVWQKKHVHMYTSPPMWQEYPCTQQSERRCRPHAERAGEQGSAQPEPAGEQGPAGSEPESEGEPEVIPSIRTPQDGDKLCPAVFFCRYCGIPHLGINCRFPSTRPVMPAMVQRSVNCQ